MIPVADRNHRSQNPLLYNNRLPRELFFIPLHRPPISGTSLRVPEANTPPVIPAPHSRTRPAIEIGIIQPASQRSSSTQPDSMANISSQVQETGYEKYVRGNELNTQNGVLVPSWSGRGRHVTFSNYKEENKALPYKDFLGDGAFGSVQAVECLTKSGKTVPIVRKCMKRKSGPDLHAFMNEVRNSAPFKHKHLIQFVGTYATADNLALLQYPVGDFTLTTFMKKMYGDKSAIYNPYRLNLQGFVKCLANALAYLHREGTVKHMDVKGENVIVKQTHRSQNYFILISDFGLTRRIHSQGVSHSSGSTAFTREYAAPEITPEPALLKTTSHNRRSDVFSLGCLYAEMATVATSNYTLENFKAYRNGGSTNGSSAFSCTLPNVFSWLDNLETTLKLDAYEQYQWKPIIGLIRRMLKQSSCERPTSENIVQELQAENCCDEVFSDCDDFWASPPASPKPNSPISRKQYPLPKSLSTFHSPRSVTI
ncbi:kinase-like protein [Zopfia rhizophila CBS 207.26]|uniref:Kinase-like protein n=1 Tax=Zopfia rhizophila CBS 207.26 TaxID=1314779 RepID=A0A6A6DUH7_9PEZI|nr:kinase-like protein [Zopfia rhizophila CBS 207.26]